MATPKDAEVRAIEVAHRAAQARLGVAGAYLAMAEWGTVSPLNASATGALWVSRSLRMINAIRRKSTRLAVSYVRLVRALETGYTLGFPEFSNDPDTLTMGDLRQEFADLLLEIATITSEESGSTDADEKWFEEQLRRTDETEVRRPNRILMADTSIDEQIQNLLDSSIDNDADKVTVEDFVWNDTMTLDDIQEQFQKALEDDVVDAADKRADKLRKTAHNPKKALALLQESHDSAGSEGGGAVDHYGIQGGREVIDHVVRKDKRVKVYARGCRPGCCAFCAMLAANGWYFTSKAGALGTTKTTSRTGKDMSPEMENGIRLYHKNCKCFVIVRYVDVPELPPENEFFKSRWGTVTAGYSYTTDKNGKGRNNALNAWRRWLNQERKAIDTALKRNEF